MTNGFSCMLARVTKFVFIEGLLDISNAFSNMCFFGALPLACSAPLVLLLWLAILDILRFREQIVYVYLNTRSFTVDLG